MLLQILIGNPLLIFCIVAALRALAVAFGVSTVRHAALEAIRKRLSLRGLLY